MDGLTATIHPHTGWLCPWGETYSYAVTADTTIQIANSRKNYKIALTLNDQSAGHGKG